MHCVAANFTVLERQLGVRMRALPTKLVKASEPELETGSHRHDIDALDVAIIRILQGDGRASFTSIAKQLEISEGAVRNRINQLTESKVLRIIGVANPIALGFNAFALIGIKVAPGCDPEKAAKCFTDLDEVTYVIFVAGRYDLMIEVVCETQEQLAVFLREHCYSRNDLGSIEPMFGLTMYKSLLKWGHP